MRLYCVSNVNVFDFVNSISSVVLVPVCVIVRDLVYAQVSEPLIRMSVANSVFCSYS